MAVSLSNVRVERTAADTLEVRWAPDLGPLPVCVYQGASPETIDRRRPAFCQTGGNRVRVAGLTPRKRPFFEVVPQGGAGVIVGERVVPLGGAINFRDLGGYRSADGRRLRWGQVFRSDSLATLDDEDLHSLQAAGLRTVCDFRSPAEAGRAPDRRPAGAAWRYLHLPVTMGSIDAVAAFERLKKGDASWFTEDFMTAGYLRNLDAYPHVWGAAIEQLAVSENRPMVFHCSAGKDRTGTLAALLLLALDVPEETVIGDYLLSNRLIAPLMAGFEERLRSFGVDPRHIAPYLTAPAECIAALLDHLKSAYGSAADYLIRHAGVAPEALSTLRRDLLV